jgi:hypothetical protein
MSGWRRIYEVPDRDAGVGDQVVQLATRIPKALYRELKLHAVVHRVTITELVTGFIAEGLRARAARLGEREEEVR